MSPVGPMKDLGPCSVLWDSPTLNLELNPSFGGIMFKDEVLHVEVKEDQQGETPVDHVHTGRIVEVTVPMTRSTLAQLEVAIRGSDDTTGSLVVSNKVGDDCFKNAKGLIIKPIVDGDPAPAATWLHIQRCYPFSSLEWTYDNEAQRVTNVVFKAYPDIQSPDVGWMWRIGPA